MAYGLVDEILDSICDSDWIRCRGEKLTEKELNLVIYFGRNGKVVRNIYVPKQTAKHMGIRNGEHSCFRKQLTALQTQMMESFEMQKYEYKFYCVFHNNKNDNIEKVFVFPNKDPDKHVEIINALGAEGWELVSVAPVNMASLLLSFKRPI